MLFGRPLPPKSDGLLYPLVIVLVVRRLGHLGLLQLRGLLDGALPLLMSDLAPRHHRMLELAHLTLDLTPHILELWPVPEQEVTATRNPSVVDTRR